MNQQNTEVPSKEQLDAAIDAAMLAPAEDILPIMPMFSADSKEVEK